VLRILSERKSLVRHRQPRIASVLGNVMGYSVDYADLYFQLVREESWSLEDSIVKDGTHSIEQGVGVRALAGEKTGFAYSDEIVLPALTEASQAARAIARKALARKTGARGLRRPRRPLWSTCRSTWSRAVTAAGSTSRRCTGSTISN